ncbi:FG-GAP repeat domain-containing protein [Reichenbachiella versicolor]|uniref:FG-GAP repeat domain-containing protein n=1 Tax=Reichenbachiella versicolor TaxID=1821036 RepID=UPI0013A56335|nr:VCBS repeat-containing protein [Reichenbachiella versicolor]
MERRIWKNSVLPRMGYLLGFRDSIDENNPSFKDYPKGKEIQENSIYFGQKKPKISREEWMAIQKYYLSRSPEKIEPAYDFSTVKSINLFETKPISLNLPQSSISMVDFLAPSKLMVADYSTGMMFQLNDQLKVTKYDSVGMGVLEFIERKDAFWTTMIGPVFIGTDTPLGGMAKYPKDVTKKLSYPIGRLQRPVNANFGDINGDTKEDIVICEFGKWSGSLGWWENTSDGYKKHEIIGLPGAICTELVDIDKDGDLDVMALLAQAREAIYLFVNDGQGRFSQRMLIQFPSTYGSSYMKLFDYNDDGLDDILVTAGDNGDFVDYFTKPYHGLRIYLNQGNYQFNKKEELFIPIPGIYKAIPSDIDLDGDLDFSVISFFPDQNQPSFLVYLNQENGYEPFKLDQNIKGRWITMSQSDFDQDGDEDIVLGAFDWGKEDKSNDKRYPVVYLENKTSH